MIEITPFMQATEIQRLRSAIYQQGGKGLAFTGVTENATQTEIFAAEQTKLVFPRESLSVIQYQALAYNYTDGTTHLAATGSYGVLCNASGALTNVAAMTSQTAQVGTTGHHALDLSTVVDDAVTLGYLRLRVTGLANKKVNWATWLTLFNLTEPNNVTTYPLGA